MSRNFFTPPKYFSLSSSKNISWSGLSEMVKGSHTLLWNGYQIEQHLNKGRSDAFMIFQSVQPSQGLSRDLNTLPKLHIALKTENIQIAFNPILKILHNHNIGSFKIILNSWVETFLEAGQFGKTFTVYMGDRHPQKQLEIALEINNALLALNIQPPELRATDSVSRTDEAIAGCVFVTKAYPRTALLSGSYNCTRIESSDSSDSFDSSNESVLLIPI